jgi:hypothetical protein
MPNTTGRATKARDDVAKRCKTCGGVLGRQAYRTTASMTPRRPLRTCPECMGAATQCNRCCEWLSDSWFGSSTVATCSLCLSLARQNRVWTATDAKRLHDAGRRVLDLWIAYLDFWTEEDLAVWRDFLAAMERIQRSEL